MSSTPETNALIERIPCSFQLDGRCGHCGACEAAEALRTQNRDVQNLKDCLEDAQNWITRHEAKIVTLTTKLTEAEAMLAVKPSAMEYAELESQLERSEQALNEACLDAEGYAEQLRTQTLRITELEAQLVDAHMDVDKYRGLCGLSPPETSE